MSNYMEYHDTVAFHPGYYLKECVEESGLTQEDFAKRLDTTPKNLSLLIRGEQSLSIDMAMKLSRMLGTSVRYWLNLQNAYDALVAEFRSDAELVEEREVFAHLEYNYFCSHFGLPKLSGDKDAQIAAVRSFLNVATLTVLRKKDMAVSFRNSSDALTETSTIKANVMVQIAVNQALKAQAPGFNRKKFEAAIAYVLTLTKNHEDFYELIKKAFWDAGVILVILPNISGSKTNGATKKIGDHIMLMVNERKLNADSFWFTLFHEVGHIVNGDYGISFETEVGEQEEAADRFAEDCLIPREKYDRFVEKNCFDSVAIKRFAEEIDRDPGIVWGAASE